MSIHSFRVKLQAFYQKFNQRFWRTPEIVQIAVQNFDRNFGAEASAAISFYAVFSLFPLLLFLVSVLGYFLGLIGSPIEIAEVITQAIPVSNELVYNNLTQILNARSIGGVIGLVGLMLTASGVFITVTRNINRAWPGAVSRNIIENRLVALLMVFVLLLLIGLWLLSTTLFNLIPRFAIDIGNGYFIHNTLIWVYLSAFIPWLFSFFVFFGVYLWIPKTKVRWTEALTGALIASIAWQLLTRAFTWFLGSGLAAFDVIYGSLGAAIALLSWIYLSSIILIMGAHLSAAIAEVRRINPTNNPE